MTWLTDTRMAGERNCSGVMSVRRNASSGATPSADNASTTWAIFAAGNTRCSQPIAVMALTISSPAPEVGARAPPGDRMFPGANIMFARSHARRVAPTRRPQAAVERARLVEQTERADVKLTLICAPAGYGKTTLMQQL